MPATVLLLGSAHGRRGAMVTGPALDGQAPDLALHRAEIDQATGMLTVQLGVPAAEAFARLRAYAYAQDRRLADVAGDIVARRLRLHRDPGQDGGPMTCRQRGLASPAALPRVFLPRDEKVNQMDAELLSDTFVELADTMVADFDVIDFLHVLTDRSVAAAGRVRGRGCCWPTRAVSCAWWPPPARQPRLLELFQLQNDQGPCLDCFRTGRPVAAADLAGRGAALAPVRRPPPSRPGSPPCRRCRCGCATRSSAR